MKKTLFVAITALLFIHCSSDNNDPVTEIDSPQEVTNYLLQIDTGNYSPEWIRIIKNDSNSVIAGCNSISVKTGDKIEIFGEIAASDDTPITLNLRDSSNNLTSTTLHKSSENKTGNYTYKACYSNGTGVTNGGKVWTGENNEKIFIIWIYQLN
ncbi:hypothetical protein [Flavobacterium akiainvivens]|uniref:hypothetical protein n=1 Tax=Flavobacterium akiainvivens TaxID=1202724 RepID=UPI0008E9ADEE|nr:hypothetical protein [Flavobacterium akiainvivens]SFQ52293.1 hypothetical protein SAMN05444144_106287 [Flavobacterium akiainvivens]